MIATGRRTSRPIVAGRVAAGRIVTAGVLAAFVLAGCAPAPAPGPDVARPVPPAPTAPAPEQASAAAEVTLPWPAATPEAAAELQAQVDRGAQPWLLDPSEVAIAYAAAAHDWPDAEAYPGPDGTSVDVRNADGERLTLSLAQPGRTGSDGIWVVTAEQG
ncbi:acyl transferase [Pseudonocardia hierapolitana]|uniref:acyl transferase n=1 Tax=Pseudonocardia hierapolitana TaxID=1128676 RepID=UPI0011BDB086|nr:acyl transferase [Pseudonocardia hierapolitana]